MKKQIGMVSLALSAALFAVSTAPAFAAGAGSHDGNNGGKHRMHRGAGMHESAGPERMLRHLTRALELDETQKQQVENIVTAAQPEMESLHARSEANRTRMRDLDVNARDYRAQLGELAAEKGAIVSEQALLYGRLKAEVNAVLTPEQRTELAERADKMREHFKERKSLRSDR